LSIIVYNLLFFILYINILNYIINIINISIDIVNLLWYLLFIINDCEV